MKRSALTLFLLITTAGASAETVKFINADGSAATATCIAALTSRTEAERTAARLGMEKLNWQNLTCNGMPAEQFIHEFGTQRTASPDFYVVKAADSSPASQLCAAAIGSSERFEQLRRRHFADIPEKVLEENLVCNNRPLKSFMQKYSNDQLTASR